MSDIPIIFSAPMVRALLDGRKTMTRRLAWQSETDARRMSFVCDGERPNPLARTAKGFTQMGGAYWLRPTPMMAARVGDRLWVRENFYQFGGPVEYAADGEPSFKRKMTPCIHMPRALSRLTLIVTATKVERLKDISMEDAKAEGLWYCEEGEAAGFWFADPSMAGDAWGEGVVECFERLWESLHGAGSWSKNPEVVALTFTARRANIDALELAA